MNLENEFGERKWDNFGGVSPLIAVFKSYHPLNPEIEKIINEQTFPVRFDKHNHIASPLKPNRFIYLILQGSVHGYIKMETEKVTTWIAIEHELAGTIRNLWTEEASDEYIEAIDPVLAIAIPHAMSRQLYEQFPIANYVGRKMTEIYFKSASERAFISRLPTAKKRYERYLVTYAYLVDRVPLKYIASFLNMRLETLSRIRAMMYRNNDKLVVEV
ncbi:Crp/Fnr family transcriptional regulator [Pedobacter agri]|uniref:Crp/Fnr family transcriptional regulator n=1 Tax=Pedobacter agri TaxID=454586 RepID=UPI00292EB7F8|nr:Crp/Fnr family transcriptional regulator [Pedobacter agri]